MNENENLSYSSYNGSKLEYKKGSTWTKIPGLLKIPAIGGEPNSISTTTLDNVKYETEQYGLMPAVKLAYEFNMEDPSAEANIKIASDLEDAKSIDEWKITYTNGITITYKSKTITSIKEGQNGELIGFSMYHNPISEPVRTIPAVAA